MSLKSRLLRYWLAFVILAMFQPVKAEYITMNIQSPSEDYHAVTVGSPGTMIEGLTFSATGESREGEFVCWYFFPDAGEWDCSAPNDNRMHLVFNISKVTDEGRILLVSEVWWPAVGEFEVTDREIDTVPFEGGELEIQVLPVLMIDQESYCCESYPHDCSSQDILYTTIEFNSDMVLKFEIDGGMPTEPNSIDSVKALYR